MKRIIYLVVLMAGFSLWTTAGAWNDGDRAIKVVKDLSHGSGKLGTYRALIIGINDYQDPKIPDLKTAVNDAQAMAEILHEKYGFEINLLLGSQATERGIYNALRRLAASAKPNESILIYYAGHGDLDRQYNDGWWIPVDAKAGIPITYLDNIQVQKAMRNMKARHVLLISDSCYSGTLFGQAREIPRVITDKYYLNLYNEKSRWGMTSGNKTPVSDDGTKGHSVFAYQLLKELAKNEKPYVSTQEIYTRIAPIVGNNSEQTPLCRPIRNTGDHGGEFIFVASSGAQVEKPDPSRGTTLSVNANVDGAQVLVDGRNVGETPLSDAAVTPGKHRISIEKEGYEPYQKRVRIDRGRAVSLFVDLSKAGPLKARLYVETTPEDARVRILNIGPVFRQGMDLDPGRYHLEVSARNYQAERMWVDLSAGEDGNVTVRLDPVVAERPAVSRQPEGAFTNNLGMKFVFIKPGSFMMGSALNPSEVASRYGGKEKYYKDEHPQHWVTLTKGFYMQSKEVTVGQWREFARGSGYKSDAETGGGAYVWGGEKWEKKAGAYWDNPGFSQTDANPVTCISWNDAQAFTKWLSREDGGDYRLPTEAEWEYAARAGTKTPFYTGDCLSTGQANYNGDYPGNSCSKGEFRKRPTPVGTFSPNRWGLYDMHGNVWEWCQDWYGGYPSGSVTDPKGASSGSYRVGRGGNWSNVARNCRSADRGRVTPGYSSSYLGFRLARAQ